jgi:antitoxin (DNA-binding transcriptional repressor) of toxin-antitoxin stability system
MERVTISQLKNSLSAYLKKVRAGQTVLILDRNEPIAVLERVDNKSMAGDERLTQLEQAGLIKRSKTSDPLGALRGYKPIKSKASVIDAVIEERRESP